MAPRLTPASRIGLMVVAAIGLAATAAAQTITEFPVLAPASEPRGLASGPGQTMWYGTHGTRKIGRIDLTRLEGCQANPSVCIMEIPIPNTTSGTDPYNLVQGSDGAIWFTEGAGNKVGRLDPSRLEGCAAAPTLCITEYASPSTFPFSIASGPDGNIWFTAGGKVARVDLSRLAGCQAAPATCITTFSISAGSVAAGPDGNVWCTLFGPSGIGRIDLSRIAGCETDSSKCLTAFATPSGTNPDHPVAGPDGNIWFTDNGPKIGRVDLKALAGCASGSCITEFPVAAPFGNLADLTSGPDGALWFIDFSSNSVGRLSTAGQVTNQYAISTPGANAQRIRTGPDGSLWLTEDLANKIGRLPLGPPPPTSVTIPVAASLHGAGGSFFHSDVRVFNRSSSTSVNVTAKYHCFTPPCGNSPQNFVLAPREMRVFDDMIAVTFNAAESGGAIEFSSTGSLVVQSRLYTPSHPSPTNGMGVPGIPESEALTSAVVTSLSHSADSSKGFRSNVGAYNASDTAQNITFTVYDGSGTALGHTAANAAARTAVQVSNIFSVIGVATNFDHAYCVVSGDHNQPLLVYAGVIDNQSQDLAFVQGQPNSRPAGADRATIPVAASIHGAGGSFFHTDATVLNVSSATAANVTARYRCFSGSCGSGSSTFTLQPREMKSFDDIIAGLFAAAESGGAIEFSSDQPIVVGSRLYTPSRPAPTNGMGVPGLAEAGAPTTAVLLSLSHSANSSKGFRSNVGAYNPNDVAQNVTFTLRDPSGTELGHVTASAPARTSVQVSNVFAAAGFAIDVPNAYCVVHGDQDLSLLPYAGVIDNQSQDLAFIGGEEDP